MSSADDKRLAPADDLAALGKEWFWFLALGIGLVIGGIVAIMYPIIATFAFVKVLGLLLLIAGIVQAFSAFWAPNWSGRLLHIVIGILYVVVGVMLIDNPWESAEVLTVLMAAFLIVSGIFRIILPMQMRFHNWGWPVLNGFISLLLGILIWIQLPGVELWVIGLFLGIDFIFNGWAWIMFGLTVRQHAHAPAK